MMEAMAVEPSKLGSTRAYDVQQRHFVGATEVATGWRELNDCRHCEQLPQCHPEAKPKDLLSQFLVATSRSFDFASSAHSLP